MTASFVQLPADSTGKKLGTNSFTQGADTVHTQDVTLYAADGTVLLGQKTGASSIPVVLASDTALPEGFNIIGYVNLNDASGNGLVTGTADPGATDRGLVVRLPASSNVIGAVTQSAGPWTSNITQMNSVAVTMGNGASGTGVQRVTIASDSTGTVAATQSGTWTVQPGNTANSTPWLTTQSPATSGGLSIATGSIGATKTDVKTSAGQVYGWYFYNSNSSVAYVQFFNATAANVTLGTTAPVYSLGIPATSGANVMADSGIAHGTAISIAITTTRAGSTGPSSTVDYNVYYK